MFVQLGEQALDRSDSALLKVELAALATYPRRNGVQRQMVPFTIDVERRNGFFHPPFTVDALHLSVLHDFVLTLNAASHSLGSGVYAVTIAKNSGFGEHTT